jgi:hypothetical protein
MEFRFRAEVQYQDWEGTAAADEHQGHGLQEFLAGKQLMVDQETLVATSLGFIEGYVYVHAFVVNRGDFESAKALIEHAEPIPVRRIDLDMSMQEFFWHFKRFDVVLTWNSLHLTGREFVEEQA